MSDRLPIESLPIEQQPEPVVCAMALLGEAWGEHDAGGVLESVAMLAIAWTGKNRTLDVRHRWPRTLREVFLYKPGAVFHFSCFNPGPLRDKLMKLHAIDPIAFERADSVLDLFEAGLTLDPTSGATHYCRKELWGVDDVDRPRPRWHSWQEIDAGRTIQTAQIGSHIFAGAA